MRRVLLGTTGAALLAVVGAMPVGATTVSGTVYETTSGLASNATPASVATAIAAGALTVTFTAPSPLNFSSYGGTGNPNHDYTIGSFLGTGGGVVTGGTGSASATEDHTLMEVTGTVLVTNGETFTAGHDDGVTLIIGGDTVISAPGASSFTTTTETYTGASGTEAFTLVYGECCGAPALLSINLPLATPTPEPASFAILGMGLLGLGAARRFWAA